MTKSALVSEELAHLAVVAVGKTGSAVAKQLSTGQPVQEFDGTEPAAFAAKLLARISTAGNSESLPAVLILADTTQATQVATLMAAMKEDANRVRPRVWPAFLSGSPAELSEFDTTVDELGTGACDVILILTGASSHQLQAQSLDAWLQVKLPAPASVLADLPDKNGRACRYVAIGAKTVSQTTPPTLNESLPAIDSDELIDQVHSMISASVKTEPLVLVADDACNAVCAAADHFDVPALIQAENSLSKALDDISRSLPAVLENKVPHLIEELLSQTETDEETTETVDEATTSSAAANRTELVAELIQLASKGSMSRMWKKNRMSVLAEQIATAARADIRTATARVLKDLDDSLQSVIEKRVVALQEQRVQANAVAAEDARVAAESTWQSEVQKARESAAIWVKIDRDSVQRSWGGGLPPARQYVVTQSSSVVALTQEAQELSVIDLRDDATDSVDGARQATVLTAQYGLPLSALR